MGLRKKKREIESDKIFDEDLYMKNYGNYFKHNCNIKLSKKGKKHERRAKIRTAQLEATL